MVKIKFRTLFIIMIVSLLVIIATSRAESIFGTLTEEEPAPERLQAPSYGAMANVDPDRVENNAEGGTIVTYCEVNAGGVNQFGEYLGGLGFGVTGQEEQDGRTAYAVSDGQVDFVMIYDPNAKTMQLVYPQGTDYEAAMFPGYTRIAFNEEINIPNLGRFTFHDFVLNDTGRSEIYFCAEDWQKRSATYIHSWLSFTYYNTTTGNALFGYSQSLGKDRNNLFGSTLIYQNTDNTYEYRPAHYGRFSPSGNRIARWVPKNTSGIVFANDYCRPLSSMEYAVSYPLADGLRSSSDGTIAIKLDFVTGEKYVLIARENGVDLNITPTQAE